MRLCLALIVCGVTAHAAPVVLLEDTFTLDPGANGWTEGGFNGNISSNGSEAVFDNTGFVSRLNIFQDIDATGYENLTVEIEAFQAATNYETTGFFGFDDSLRVSAGGTEVFSNVGVFTGVNGTSVAGAGNTVPTTAAVLLPVSLDDSLFSLNVQTQSIDAFFGARNEDFFISSIRVTGDLIAAVPEASSLLLLGFFAAGLVHWETRRRSHLRFFS